MDYFDIELYYEDGYYIAVIGPENGTGYFIKEKTISERARRIGQFFESVGD